MILQSEVKKQIDQHIKLFITDIEGNKVEFSTLPIYEKIGALTTATYTILVCCNEQIKNEGGYLVNLETLDAIEELAFMMNIIMKDVDNERKNTINFEEYNHE